MIRCNTLRPIEYDSFKQNVDYYKHMLKNELKYDFFQEKYQPHITFLFFGDLSYNDKKASMEESKKLFNELDENEKIIHFGDIELLEGRNYSHVVIKLKISKKVEEIRTQLYKKYKFKDKHVDYKPHVTLGKYKSNRNFNPSIKKATGQYKVNVI